MKSIRGGLQSAVERAGAALASAVGVSAQENLRKKLMGLDWRHVFQGLRYALTQ